MLRIFAKTTLLAAALAATFGLLSLSAMAEEPQALPVTADLEATADCPVDAGSVAGAGQQVGAGGLAAALHGQIQNCRPQYYGQPELFYNYYMPGTCGGVPAAMYLAPQPVPAMVGHTYYTYQPFMPHELLYQHHRTYYRYYDGGRGMTRTHVSWSRPPFTGWSSSLRIAR